MSCPTTASGSASGCAPCGSGGACDSDSDCIDGSGGNCFDCELAGVGAIPQIDPIDQGCKVDAAIDRLYALNRIRTFVIGFQLQDSDNLNCNAIHGRTVPADNPACVAATSASS